jgi:hypothetical protein
MKICQSLSKVRLKKCVVNDRPMILLVGAVCARPPPDPVALAREHELEFPNGYWNASYSLEKQRRLADVPCAGPHTVRTPAGACECEPGFAHGEPETVWGCWNCADTCHAFAECAHTGRCECLPRHRGDGILVCDPIYPQILEMEPIAGLSDEATPVTIAYNYAVEHSWYKTAPKCRFGSVIVEGAMEGESLIRCEAPPAIPGTVPVAIAFAGSEWSREAFSFTYQKKYNFFIFVTIIGAYGMAIAGFGVCLWWAFRSTPRRRTTGSDGMPLIGIARSAGATRRRKVRWVA